MSHLPPHLAQVVEKLHTGLKELYGDRFRDLLLYGSYARGDFREGSDIDLLLLLDGPVNPVEEIIRLEPVKWPLSLANDVVLSVMPASFQAYQRGQTNFLRVVGQEAVRAREGRRFLAAASEYLKGIHESETPAVPLDP